VRNTDALALFHDLGLPNVVRLRVERHVPDEGITFFTPAATQKPSWTGPLLNVSPGDEVRVMVRPEDIALSLHQVKGISVRNQVRGSIKEMIIQGSRALCIVDTGIELLVDLTPDAIHGLELENGREVWCIFKAHALRYLV
jgi:ABC-type molybdate transport system ATPase subunit